MSARTFHESTPGVSHDPGVRFPSTWRQPVGKPLTSRRITELQREGYYGAALKLPPKVDARPCLHCKSTINTWWMAYGYLPTCGVYCSLCRKAFKDEGLKAKEQRRAEREAFKQQWEEYV